MYGTHVGSALQVSLLLKIQPVPGGGRRAAVCQLPAPGELTVSFAKGRLSRYHGSLVWSFAGAFIYCKFGGEIQIQVVHQG